MFALILISFLDTQMAHAMAVLSYVNVTKSVMLCTILGAGCDCTAARSLHRTRLCFGHTAKLTYGGGEQFPKR